MKNKDNKKRFRKRLLKTFNIYLQSAVIPSLGTQLVFIGNSRQSGQTIQHVQSVDQSHFCLNNIQQPDPYTNYKWQSLNITPKKPLNCQLFHCQPLRVLRNRIGLWLHSKQTYKPYWF